MEINDARMKHLIPIYQKTGREFATILEHLSLFIYYFPRMVTNNCRDDVFGEYYQYFLERFPKILMAYTPMENVLFKTWFYLVQRRHYLNFLKSRKNNSLVESNYEFMESFTIDTVGFSVPSANPSEVDSHLSTYLAEDDLLFMKLFSPENLSPQDLQKLMRLLNCDLPTLHAKIRLLFDYAETKDKKKIVRLVPINRVADFLGWNRLKVSKKLAKIREKVQKNYVWED